MTTEQITAAQITDELINRGYNASLHETIKNGVIFQGIVIKTEAEAAPVIYTDRIAIESETVQEAADLVLRINAENAYCPISSDVLNDGEWILEHITIALQRSSNEPLEKKDTEFEGIEQYLMLVNKAGNFGYSLKVTPELLKSAKVNSEDAWRVAMNHLSRDTKLESLNKKISEILGKDIDEDLLPGKSFQIISTFYETKGASAILNRDVLSRYAKQYNTEKIVVLPSSIHEMIILPYDNSVNLDALSAMVKEINETQVLPEDRLTDRAYLLCV